MRLFQAPLDTCLDSPFSASLSVHGLHFTVYAPSRKSRRFLISESLGTFGLFLLSQRQEKRCDLEFAISKCSDLRFISRIFCDLCAEPAVRVAIFSGLQKRPAERGHVQKCQKESRIFFDTFQHFSRRAKKVINRQHFSTLFDTSAPMLIRLPLPQCFCPRGRKLRPWSEKNSDQNSDHPRLCIYWGKEKLRPWSEFLGRENSDHGLSFGCFWGRGRRTKKDLRNVSEKFKPLSCL